MYEKVEFDQLVKGERYFIKYLNKSKFKTRSSFGRFYNYYGYHSQIAIFRNMSKHMNSYYGEPEEKFHKTSLYYKIISFKEFRQKLIEKFQESALRIILKKIVNEDFEWI